MPFCKHLQEAYSTACGLLWKWHDHHNSSTLSDILTPTTNGCMSYQTVISITNGCMSYQTVTAITNGCMSYQTVTSMTNGCISYQTVTSMTNGCMSYQTVTPTTNGCMSYQILTTTTDVSYKILTYERQMFSCMEYDSFHIKQWHPNQRFHTKYNVMKDEYNSIQDRLSLKSMILI